MKHRKLRIAWSVTWGMACVLLIALWVRRSIRRQSSCATALAALGRLGTGEFDNPPVPLPAVLPKLAFQVA
jgi:hypothetical protein